VDVVARAGDRPRVSLSAWARGDRVAAGAALAAFAVLCVMALSFAPRLVEPDDYAYRASIVAMTQGDYLTLSTAQVEALAAQLTGPSESPLAGGPAGIPQWVQLANGQWISEKNPGYPFLAAPFQALGIIRLAPLFYGAPCATSRSVAPEWRTAHGRCPCDRAGQGRGWARLPFQTRLLARAAPSVRAASFAQPSSGWMREPNPQSAPAMMFSAPSRSA
jgi:hypothetical protein